VLGQVFVNMKSDEASRRLVKEGKTGTPDGKEVSLLTGGQSHYANVSLLISQK
jgi:hypothetical protein